MPRNQKTSALVMVLAAVLGMAYTVIAGNTPLLGLDLQGGVSVVLQPTEPADDEALDQAISIIRNRVDALGVAEPEISRQGDNIVVDLPGVEEQQRALELVGQTAELRFRPVIVTLAAPAAGGDGATPTPDGSDPSTTDPATTGPTATTAPPAGDPSATTAPPVDGAATTTAAPDQGATTTAPAPADGEQSLPATAGRFDQVALVQAAATEGEAPAATEPGATTTTVAGAAPPTDGSAPAAGGAPVEGGGEGEGTEAAPPPTEAQQAAAAACFGSGAVVTPPEEDEADDYVLLPDDQGTLYCLGPTLLTGDAIDTASALPLGVGEWQVNPVFRSGEEGIDRFNRAAQSCYAGDADICPTRSLAIVLDHQVIVAPQINAPAFEPDRIQITGGFTQDEAQDVATVLRYGALPVELEAQQTRTVSATIGDDALRAGLIAGVVGLVVVALYLLAYYRLAGLVVIAGLSVSGMLLWTIISWFGETQGLALTVSGIVGIIVSIGVAADSNIVYFENVRDAMREGRTVRTAVERAYRSSISTIVKADVIALLAAGLLYWLTVGAVRGFAFYLGLATALDLLVAWFFMRPALNWLTSRRRFAGTPSRVGLATGQPTTGGAR